MSEKIRRSRNLYFWGKVFKVPDLSFLFNNKPSFLHFTFLSPVDFIYFIPGEKNFEISPLFAPMLLYIVMKDPNAADGLDFHGFGMS